jgi:hypothetical protein
VRALQADHEQRVPHMRALRMARPGSGPPPPARSSGRAAHPALPARPDAPEAERLAPVPRASHTLAVDVEDLALVTAYIAGVAAAKPQGRKPEPMSGDTAAWHRLNTAVRRRARSAA